ncbi:hypothetical protein [Acinetobacter phage vB_AbaS_TCUP2199]|nr:hypothetical protein [Acinetobacter phage vB_AbaS_TCUP2199]
MIKKLKMRNWAKHHDREFFFEAGLNMIRGVNEGGKSLILEAIDYALHGSVALRLPASLYPTNLSSELTVVIRGKEYFIQRSPKMAILTDVETDTVLAKGTKPVDAEIRKILGYSRSVFMVSNYSSQNAIDQLAALKPAERKRVIDNVVGLTAVEEVIGDHKVELSALNKMLAGHKARLPDNEPVKPAVDLPDYLSSQKMYLREEMTRVQGYISRQEQIAVTHQRLMDTKPEQLHFDEVRLQKMLIPEGIDRAAAAKHDATLKSKKDMLAQQQALLEAEKQPEYVPEPDTAWLIEGMTRAKWDAYNQKTAQLNAAIDKALSDQNALETRKKSLTYISQADLDDLYVANNLYKDWLNVQELKAKGSLTCDSCGSEVHLMKDHLAKYQHVPETVAKPTMDYDQAVKEHKWYNEIQEEITKAKDRVVELMTERDEHVLTMSCYSNEQIEQHFKIENQLELWKESLKKYEDYKYRTGTYKDNCERLEAEIIELETNWYDEKTLADNFYAIDEFEKLEKQNASLLVWQRNFDALPTYEGDEAVEKAKLELKELNEKEAELQALEYEWDVYKRDKAAYDAIYSDYEVVKTQVDAEKEIIETLQLYKAKIKSTILPSVNSVASSWIQRMSLGKHVSVALTDDMEILVNNEPIEALSISGRALGHLSLRMALGQVLTNSIFPVFMADEVDASMRNERAQAVLDNLVKMLDGSVKQIIMISHRELENIQNVIEV